MSAPLTREERTDRLADLRAREAVRKVTLSGVPLMDLPLERRIAFAVFDPGVITPRGDNYKEPLFRWQARAITYVMPETAAEVARLTAEVDETAAALHFNRERRIQAEAEVARLSALVTAMHAAAVGEVKPPLLGLVEDVALTRDAYEAQQARADTLNRLALQHRARVAELEAELEAERNERCPAFQGDGDLCTACGDARRWHRATEAGESA